MSTIQIELTKPEILFYVSDESKEAIIKFEQKIKIKINDCMLKRTSSNHHLIKIEGVLSHNVCAEIENAYRSVGWSEAVCKEGFTPNTTVLKLYQRL